jgi:hypothetical protein
MHDENTSETLATDGRKGRRTMKAQSEIGWRVAMRGWLSREWSAMQEKWLERNRSEQNREHSGNTWSAKVSRWLIRKSREFWTERNHQRQENSSPDDQGISRAEKDVNDRLERLYAREMNVAQRDREIFRIPINTRKRMSIRQKQTWLDRVTPHVNEAEKRFRERSAKGQMDILEMWDKKREENVQAAPEAMGTPVETSSEEHQSSATEETIGALQHAQNEEQPQNNSISEEAIEGRAPATHGDTKETAKTESRWSSSQGKTAEQHRGDR